MEEALVLEKEKHHQEDTRVKKSRSGVAIKSFEGGQMPLYRRLPKRGFKSLKKINTAVLNLSNIQKLVDIKKHDLKNTLSLKILKEKKLINKKFFNLKILGSGELKNNVDITAYYT